MGKQKGVALLIALSVTLILGIFLTNNFEKNRTNLKLLSNTQSKFTLDIVSFSILKTIALAIKKNGANYVYDFVSIIASIPDFPLNITQNPNINIYNPQVWSMQHYFYLNRSFDNEKVKVFNGILNQNLEKASAIDKKQLLSATDKSITNSLAQWKTNTNNSNLVKEFPVYRRNSYFDLNSEVYFFLYETLKARGKILKADFQDQLKFRIYSTSGKNDNQAKNDLSEKSTCKLSPFNVNMVPKNSQNQANEMLEDYLEWFGFHSNNNCKKVKEKTQNILDSIINRFYSDEEGLLLITDIGNNYFKAGLGGLQATKEAKTYFTYRSNLVGVKYELENKASRIQVEAHFYLEYKSSNQTDIPDTVHIIYYKVS